MTSGFGDLDLNRNADVLCQGSNPDLQAFASLHNCPNGARATGLHYELYTSWSIESIATSRFVESESTIFGMKVGHLGWIGSSLIEFIESRRTRSDLGSKRKNNTRERRDVDHRKKGFKASS